MNEYIEQLRAFYGGLAGSQRIALFGALAASLIAVGGVTWWSSQESYSTIYRGNPSEIGRVTAALDEAGVNYRIGASGGEVQVPTAERGAGMVAAASGADLTGMDIFGSIDMGTSPSMEREYRTRALEVELQRTVNSLTEISGSRVHIVPPEGSSMLLSDKRASASVTIQTGGAGLRRKQLLGIARLVAGAVKGMGTEDVSIIGEDGSLLFPDAGAEEGMADVATINALSIERRQQLIDNVRGIAQRVFGTPDAVSVSVGVELVTASTQQVENNLNPDLQAVVSEQISEERSKEAAGARGAPGTANNLPEQAAGPGGGGETERTDITTNFATSSTQRTTTTPPGSVKRITAAVTIDDALVKAHADASNGAISEAALKTSLEESITAALGIDTGRGDVLKVTFVPFAPAEDAASDSGALSTLTYSLEGYLPSIVALIAVILFFTVVARPIVSFATRSRPAKAAEKSDEEKMIDEVAAMGNPTLLMRKLRHSIDNFEAVDARDLNRLASMHEDPAAAVLRRWLKAS